MSKLLVGKLKPEITDEQKAVKDILDRLLALDKADPDFKSKRKDLKDSLKFRDLESQAYELGLKESARQLREMTADSKESTVEPLIEGMYITRKMAELAGK